MLSHLNQTKTRFGPVPSPGLMKVKNTEKNTEKVVLVVQYLNAADPSLFVFTHSQRLLRVLVSAVPHFLLTSLYHPPSLPVSHWCGSRSASGLGSRVPSLVPSFFHLLRLVLLQKPFLLLSALFRNDAAALIFFHSTLAATASPAVHTQYNPVLQHQKNWLKITAPPY